MTLAWAINADKLARYESFLPSLMYVLLPAPQNPFYVQQAAETTYAALAPSIKMFLTDVDMTDGGDSKSLVELTPIGITVHVWYGVKLVGPSFCFPPPRE